MDKMLSRGAGDDKSTGKVQMSTMTATSHLQRVCVGVAKKVEDNIAKVITMTTSSDQAGKQEVIAGSAVIK